VTSSLNYLPTSYTSLGTACNGAGFAGSGSYATPRDFDTAFITEHITDSLGRGASHPCLHKKYEQDADYSGSLFGIPTAFGGGLFGVTVVNDGGRAQAASAEASYSSFAWDTSNPVASIPPFWSDTSLPVNEELLKSRLLQRASQLKADVLLNIVESNQIVPSIRSLTTSLPQMATNWKSIRKVMRTAAGSYLAWKFGVSPLLQDIMAIHRYLPKIKEQFKRHNEQKPSRFSEVAALNFTIAPSAYANGYAPLNGVNTYAWDWQGQVLAPPELRFVLVVKPSAKHSNELTKAIDFVISRFASSPADLAWELVPFSFVVDWFVDLSGVFRLIDKIIGFSPYEVISFTKTRSYKLGTQAILDVRTPCGGGSIGSYLSNHTYSFYERSLVSGSALPIWNPRFGKNQAAISVALITQALTSISSKRVITTAVSNFNRAIQTGVANYTPAVARTVKRLQRAKIKHIV
jgi:hypothetical protein